MIDLNFYPERHMGEISGLLDIEVPNGWTVGRFVRAAHEASLMLWAALNTVDGDGNIVPKWK